MKQASPSVKIDISRVAQLANIPLSEKEKETLEKELTETLDYIATLNSIDTKHVEPTSQVTGLTNVLRKDEAMPSLSQNEALQNAQTYNGFFKVPAILDNE
jgi:aspartyl-tRNA(Asn)/glutamyl-tRNA(Gln) amidotransferase subunit C